jgi:hypothetical protein
VFPPPSTTVSPDSRFSKVYDTVYDNDTVYDTVSGLIDLVLVFRVGVQSEIESKSTS